MENFNSFSKLGKVYLSIILYEKIIILGGEIPLKCTSITDQKFYYCYTLFIQMKNNKYKRGYMQKSIMIVSEFYYKKLFLDLLLQFKKVFVSETGQTFPLKNLEKLFLIFNNAEKYQSDIKRIQNIEKNNVINDDSLTVSSKNYEENKSSQEFTEIKLEENKNSQEKNNSLSSDERSSPLANSGVKNFISEINEIKSNYDVSIYPQNNNFFEYLSIYYISKIWNIWELVITETPLLVQADSPSLASEIVFLLSSLIFPLKYCGDVRPYFTIYDNDFKDYRDQQDLKDLNSPILGVINPICAKSFSNFCVLHFDDNYYHENKIENPTKNFNKNLINDEVLTLVNYKKKFIVMPNKTLIKTFMDFIEDPENKSYDKLNIYLRMYLIELNNDFMRTFEEYFFLKESNELRRIALIKPNFSIFEIFNKDKFIKYLNSQNNYFNVKYVNNKKKTIELYTRFIETKCFNFYLKNLLSRIKNFM